MKKIIIVIGLLLATGIAMRAQELYNAGEFGVDLTVGVRTANLDDEESNYGFGLQYYITRNLGLGAYTTLTEMGGHTFENVSVRGLWRIPIEKHAFYFFGGVTRQLHVGSEEDGWSLQLGPGYQYMLVEHVSLFSEVGLDKVWTGDERPLAATIRGGLRFSF